MRHCIIPALLFCLQETMQRHAHSDTLLTDGLVKGPTTSRHKSNIGIQELLLIWFAPVNSMRKEHII